MRVRVALDQLVETARDPTGLNTRRGEFQVGRLKIAILDVLELGGILPGELVRRLRHPSRVVAIDESSIWDEVRDTTSLARDGEVFAEVTGLFKLMSAIKGRVNTTPAGSGYGAAVGRLEELLTVVYDSATALEDELARLGTSAVEQTVLFYPAEGGSDMSLAQFIGWARAVGEPFTRVDNRTASLTASELTLLHAELGSLTTVAEALTRVSPGYGVALPGPRRQLFELTTFLQQAHNQASGMQQELSPTAAAAAAATAADTI